MAEKEPILVSDRSKLQELAHYRRGYVPEVKYRPVLVYQAIEHGVMCDGFLLVENKEATQEVVGKYLAKEQAKEVKNLLKNNPNLSQPEATKLVKDRFEAHAKEGTFPNYKELYKGELGKEAKLIGMDENPERNYGVDAIAYLSDGEHIMGVNADKLAFALKYLPETKMFLSRQNPAGSPLTFMDDGKKKGLLMPLYIQQVPGAIKDAVSKVKTEVTPKPPEPQLLAAPKPEPKPPAEAKEPWKMTRKEFISQRESETRKGYAGLQGLAPKLDESWRKRTGGAHEQLVEDALSEGKSVPIEVLKDYPDLIKQAKPSKEPWQMTQKEYTQYMSDTFEPIFHGQVVGKKVRWHGTSEQAIAKQKADMLRGVPEHHRYSIKQALASGKPVPAEVLKDYPELVKAKGYEARLEGKDTFENGSDINKYAIYKDGKYITMEVGKTPQEALEYHYKTSKALPKAEAPAKPETKIPIDYYDTLAEYYKAHGIIEKVPKQHKEIGVLQAKPTKQSDRALAIDRSLLAKQVVSVDDPRWLKRPNRFDVRGVDTPGSGRIVSRTGFTDRGKTRMARRHHRGWKRIEL